MVQKFLGKVSRNSENCRIFEMRPIQLKIPGEKLIGKKTCGKIFRKIWVFVAGSSSVLEYFQMLFHSLLEVAENSHWTF